VPQLKIEKTRSNKPCIACGKPFKQGDVVFHFLTITGYQWMAYVGMHVNCLPLFISEAKKAIQDAPERFNIKIDEKIIGGLKVTQ
jgi:hypothetical protein